MPASYVPDSVGPIGMLVKRVCAGLMTSCASRVPPFIFGRNRRFRESGAQAPCSSLTARSSASSVKTATSLRRDGAKQAQGAHNINLVTPTHYAPHIHRALEIARRDGLDLPVVYNTSSYERPCVLHALNDDVHVWLPDFKYASPDLAWELSRARDYPEVALEAIGVMVEQVRRAGGRRVDDDGIMQHGVIVRHLVLPGHLDDTFRVLQMLWVRFGNDIDISIMNQYTPVASAEVLGSHTELSVPLPQEDYEAALDFSDMLGFENLWWQQGGTVGESFIPAFDGSGVVSGGQA